MKPLEGGLERFRSGVHLVAEQQQTDPHDVALGRFRACGQFVQPLVQRGGKVNVEMPLLRSVLAMDNPFHVERFVQVTKFTGMWSKLVAFELDVEVHPPVRRVFFATVLEVRGGVRVVEEGRWGNSCSRPAPLMRGKSPVAPFGCLFQCCAILTGQTDGEALRFGTRRLAGWTRCHDAPQDHNLAERSQKSGDRAPAFGRKSARFCRKDGGRTGSPQPCSMFHGEFR